MNVLGLAERNMEAERFEVIDLRETTGRATDRQAVAKRTFDRQAAAKRAFDIVVGSVLLFLTLPIIVLTAIGSAITLRAWPFFVQDRIGIDGRTFKFVKVRSLPRATNAYADKYELADVQMPAFTRALRGLHLDELPQLALVVAGKMSLVGPRPEMPPLHATLPPHFASERTRVRPGCTGLWQVEVHCDSLISEAPEYDTFYVGTRSLRLDLWILVQTLRKVANGGHATVTLADLPAWVHGRAASPAMHAA